MKKFGIADGRASRRSSVFARRAQDANRSSDPSGVARMPDETNTNVGKNVSSAAMPTTVLGS